MSVLMEFSLFPTDRGESKSQYVARSIEIIQKSGLPYKMGAMGTTVEGDLSELLELVKQCHDAMDDCNRIFASIKIDSRKDRGNRLTRKIDSVREKVNEEIKS